MRPIYGGLAPPHTLADAPPWSASSPRRALKVGHDSHATPCGCGRRNLIVALGGLGAASPGDSLGVSGTALGPDQIGYSRHRAPERHPARRPVRRPVRHRPSLPGRPGYVGNYQGFIIYDISEPSAPVTLSQVNCPGSQNDITVSGDLVYLSTDSSRSDDSCRAPRSRSTTPSRGRASRSSTSPTRRRRSTSSPSRTSAARTRTRWFPATTPTTSTSRATARRARRPTASRRTT